MTILKACGRTYYNVRWARSISIAWQLRPLVLTTEDHKHVCAGVATTKDFTEGDGYVM